MRQLLLTVGYIGALLSGSVMVQANDWPQWQGADRTRISKETGLLKAWPSSGPRLVWTGTGLGAGYGSMAVVGGRVFVQGTRGSNSVVIALNRVDGKEVWSKALGRSGDDDRGPGPRGTPSVDGDRLYVLTEAGDLACLKVDGTAVWQRNILREFNGRQLQWLISESPLVDGPHLIVSPGAKVFFASNYGTGGGLVDLTAQNGSVSAKEVYFTTNMKNHHGGMVLVDGYLYGFNDSILTCLEFATGRMMWRDRSVGKGSVTYADGRLYLQSENNVVGLAEATSTGYRETGRFDIPDKGWPSWAHPVISDGRLYVRNQDSLMVYDVRDGAR